jgi:hypothetical protein
MIVLSTPTRAPAQLRTGPRPSAKGSSAVGTLEC